ncbi:YrhB domain-containing protein [Streptomyces sp. NPDC005483]|uniref:YrhB domain-containing protein n=1 Tax=Streptomyces sp. NPDC005483 TaxID=3154882 RepID=UPI0033BF7C5C
MITAEQAHRVVEMHLAQTPAEDDIAAVIISITEHRFGWEFHYQSATWARTRRTRDLWVGTGPIVVDRRDGGLHQLGGPQFGDTVADYQRQYDNETSTLLSGDRPTEGTKYDYQEAPRLW